MSSNMKAAQSMASVASTVRRRGGRLASMVSRLSMQPELPEVEVQLEQKARVKTLLDQWMTKQDDDRRRASGNRVTPATGPDGSKKGDRNDDMRRLEQLIISLSTCYQLYGCPTHVLEHIMEQVAKGLGHDAQFAVFTNYILVSFSREESSGLGSQTLYFTTQSGYDMFRLQLVDELCSRVASYAKSTAPLVSKSYKVLEKTLSTMPSSATVLDTTTSAAPVFASQTVNVLPGIAEGSPHEEDDASERVGDTSANLVGVESLGPSQAGSPTRQPAELAGTDTLTPATITEAGPAGQNRKDTSDYKMATTSAPSSFPQSNPLEAGRSESPAQEPPVKQDIEMGSRNVNRSRSPPPALPAPLTADRKSIIGSRRSLVKEPVVLTEEQRMKKAILESAALGTGIFASPNTSSEDMTKDHSIEGRIRSMLQFTSKPKKRPSTAFETEFTRIAIEDANERLHQIISLPPLYSHKLLWLCNGVSSAGCAASFFGGSWYDVLASFLQGCLVGILGNISTNSAYTKLYEFISALIVGAITSSLTMWQPEMFCYGATTLSSVIWLLQGVTLTLSMVELATKNVNSGTPRLFYGITVSGFIGFGLNMGASLAETVLVSHGVTANMSLSCKSPISEWWNFVSVPATTLAFSFLLNAHYKQLPPMLAVAVIAFLTSYYTATWGVAGSSVISAFLVGFSSNVYARWSGDPAIISALSGLLVLVPGSMAVRGFTAVLGSDVAGGLTVVMNVFVAALSLGIGLFLATLMLPPREIFLFLHRQQTSRQSRLYF